MKNSLIAVVLSLLFVGCASTSSFAPLSEEKYAPHNGKINIYSKKPENCTELGWVSATQTMSAFEWLDILELVKKKAAKNGATGVIFNSTSTKGGGYANPRSVLCLAIRQDSKY